MCGARRVSVNGVENVDMRSTNLRLQLKIWVCINFYPKQITKKPPVGQPWSRICPNTRTSSAAGSPSCLDQPSLQRRSFISSRRVTLYRTIGMKIVAKMLCGFPKNILTKIEIALSPVVRSALKPSQVGFDMYRFGWCAREVQENSVVRE